MKKQVELKRLREAEERAKRNEEEAKLEKKILEQQERIRCAHSFSSHMSKDLTKIIDLHEWAT